MDQFEMERTAAQQYSLNWVQHEHDSDNVTPGVAEEFEDLFKDLLKTWDYF